MVAMAQHEAKMISARTKSALTAAKARGIQLGGIRWEIDTVAKRAAEQVTGTRKTANKCAQDLLPLIEAIRAEDNTSLNAIAVKLNERGIQAPRRGCWHPNSVRQVL
jgi:DNA invertase Pin-like site-specific DNA recombinase